MRGSMTPAEDRLDSWKEIAAYLKKGVRTVQRWERTDGLPVRRLGQDRQGSVFAYKSELDAWWELRSRKPEAPAAAVRTRTRWPAAILGAIAVAAVLGWTTWPTAPAAYRAVPLTAEVGRETNPSFSPDGRRLAYMASATGERPHIYVKTIGSDAAVRLTSGAEPDGLPAWSPDGQWIAFLRPSAGQSWLAMRIPAAGGAETRLAEIAYASALSWSPDSRWLVAVDGPLKMRSIVAIAVADGSKHVLTAPYEFGYGGFGLSPDGRRLIFSRNGPGATPIYELPLGAGLRPAGDPRAVTDKFWIGELRVSDDGKQVLYIDASGEGGNLVRLRLSAGAKPEIVYSAWARLLTPAISRDGRRIAFAARPADHEEIWRKSLADPAEPPAPLIKSTHAEMNPQYSPDGRWIAFHSTRTGESDIWIADADGRNPRRLTYTNARTTATPRWSPDGKWIAFESNQTGQTEVYVVPSGGGAARRLTDNPAVDAIPRWSRDGREIYFCSDRTGRYEVWKVAASGGPATQVTKDGGFVAVESPDGRWLYYSQTRNFGPVFRMPLGGGPSEELIPQLHGLFFAVTQSGIYYGVEEEIWCWEAV